MRGRGKADKKGREDHVGLESVMEDSNDHLGGDMSDEEAASASGGDDGASEDDMEVGGESRENGAGGAVGSRRRRTHVVSYREQLLDSPGGDSDSGDSGRGGRGAGGRGGRRRSATDSDDDSWRGSEEEGDTPRRTPRGRRRGSAKPEVEGRTQAGSRSAAGGPEGPSGALPPPLPRRRGRPRKGSPPRGSVAGGMKVGFSSLVQP
jgi:hypothetical protein